MKKRIDRLLVERGLADSREKAQALIMAGNVLVDDEPARKAGLPVDEGADIQLKKAPHPYVSRGGIKLQGAVEDFGLHVQGNVCLDIGSSTGGFTHFLLLHGAERVYALDVDVKQLDWKIRGDSRVRAMELNARYLEPAHIHEPIDLVTVDASFISLTLLLPRIPLVLKRGGKCLALVKPQFEVGRHDVGKGGIVRDPKLQHAAIDKVTEAGRNAGLEFMGSQESRITGREGNREFFVLFKKT
ncbi:MAG: TlyA family rRNA (cytidine-2'-O)-methyltransferase [Acidobacteria bacterium]|nr:MAG: TlyA family rRNA (cytidine-2'-O)-methyltransferase [Acidobacteriota bacterium]